MTPKQLDIAIINMAYKNTDLVKSSLLAAQENQSVIQYIIKESKRHEHS